MVHNAMTIIRSAPHAAPILPQIPFDSADARVLRDKAQVVDTKFGLIRLLERGEAELASLSVDDAGLCIRRLVDLPMSELKTFASSQLSCLVKQLVFPHAKCLTKRQLNDFLRRLPVSAREALGIKEIPVAPYRDARAPHLLGFNPFTRLADKRGTFDALNACLRFGEDYELHEIQDRGIKMSFAENQRPAHHYSGENGLSHWLQDELLSERGYDIHTLGGLDGKTLDRWLEMLGATQCIIESVRPGVQFPNGLVENGIRQAALNRDESGNWWLLNSSDQVATPANFDLIALGDFRFKALAPRVVLGDL